jgi:hypothetical protein
MLKNLEVSVRSFPATVSAVVGYRVEQAIPDGIEIFLTRHAHAILIQLYVPRTSAVTGCQLRRVRSSTPRQLCRK